MEKREKMKNRHRSENLAMPAVVEHALTAATFGAALS